MGVGLTTPGGDPFIKGELVGLGVPDLERLSSGDDGIPGLMGLGA